MLKIVNVPFRDIRHKISINKSNKESFLQNFSSESSIESNILYGVGDSGKSIFNCSATTNGNGNVRVLIQDQSGPLRKLYCLPWLGRMHLIGIGKSFATIYMVIPNKSQ